MEPASGMAYEPPLTPQSPTTSTNSFYSPYIFAGESSTPSVKVISGLDVEYAGYQALDLSATRPLDGNGSLVAGVPTDGTLRDGMDPHLSTAIIQNAKNRRRVQNREAQRRFRDRKDQLNKTLQQKTDDLRSEYEALHDEHTRSNAEVSRLQRENDALRCEVKGLRQQQRLMLTVLRLSQRNSQLPGDAGFLDDIQSCCCSGDLDGDPPLHSSG